jgi:ferredoxin
MTTRCAYCHADVTADNEQPPPPVDDDRAWSELANEHAESCEWIATRAHLLPDVPK